MSPLMKEYLALEGIVLSIYLPYRIAFGLTGIGVGCLFMAQIVILSWLALQPWKHRRRSRS